MKHLSFTALILASLNVSCMSSVTSSTVKQSEPSQVNALFVEQAQETFFKDIKNRKGWDAPTIADLDQDGYPDIILNDHGYGLRVMWNNQGKFSFPYDILMGDLHGVSVGDINIDGKLDLIISRGGGSGTNARNSIIYSVDKERRFEAWPNFEEPLALMRGRTVKFVDLDNDGDLDLINFAYASKGLRTRNMSENYIYENNGKGVLLRKSSIPITHGDGQKTLLTDFNNDHKTDLIVYGTGAIKAYQGNGDLTFTDVSKKILPHAIKDVTGVAEIDFDNDGDFDLVMSRGLPFEKGETFYDANTKKLGFYTKRGKFQFDDLTVGDTLFIENYQSPWPEKVPYIGESGYKLDYPGETQSGRTIDLLSTDALGYPDSLSGKKGAYIGFVGNKQWRIAGNLFAPFSGVVHNVADYPAYKHRKGLTDIVLENKQGKFVNVSNEVGLTQTEHSSGVIVGDFDNNGLMDLVMMQRGQLIHANQSLLYLNTRNEEGGNRFVLQSSHGVISPELGASGLSGEVIDYNLDGKLDIVTGNERGQWHLFNNTIENNNHFLKVKLPVTHNTKVSSKGALVQVNACGITQQKRLGATGANYSTSYDLFLHFGLGECQQSVDVNVIWPDNSQSEFTQVSTNQIFSVQ